MRADGPDSRVLADVVAHTFGLRGQEYVSAEWDSWKGEDGRWVVALSWRAGRSDNRALWTFQPGAQGGTVTAIDEHAHDLVEGLPARPLRTVGPVIDISRPDEQPPPMPEEGHELRAAASDIAARRDVSDWSRTAPEPRRPESSRRSAPSVRQELSRPESNGAVTRTRPDPADEPATDWPVAQRDTEIRDDNAAKLGDTTKRDVATDAAPAAAAPAPTEKPAEVAETAVSTEAACEATVDDTPSPEPALEAPAPREAEPEATTGSPAPKRSRKGKPVMPSWDEVLLGVRSQR
jgi:hypothetical protein